MFPGDVNPLEQRRASPPAPPPPPPPPASRHHMLVQQQHQQLQSQQHHQAPMQPNRRKRTRAVAAADHGLDDGDAAERGDHAMHSHQHPQQHPQQHIGQRRASNTGTATTDRYHLDGPSPRTSMGGGLVAAADESGGFGGGSAAASDVDAGESTTRGAAAKRRPPNQYIQEKAKRHITFSKRKAGLLKKANELACLTGTEILLLVASEAGTIFFHATDKFRQLVEPPDARRRISQCLYAARVDEAAAAAAAAAAEQGGATSSAAASASASGGAGGAGAGGSTSHNGQGYAAGPPPPPPPPPPRRSEPLMHPAAAADSMMMMRDTADPATAYLGSNTGSSDQRRSLRTTPVRMVPMEEDSPPPLASVSPMLEDRAAPDPTAFELDDHHLEMVSMSAPATATVLSSFRFVRMPTPASPAVRTVSAPSAARAKREAAAAAVAAATTAASSSMAAPVATSSAAASTMGTSLAHSNPLTDPLGAAMAASASSAASGMHGLGLLTGMDAGYGGSPPSQSSDHFRRAHAYSHPSHHQHTQQQQQQLQQQQQQQQLQLQHHHHHHRQHQYGHLPMQHQHPHVTGATYHHQHNHHSLPQPAYQGYGQSRMEMSDGTVSLAGSSQHIYFSTPTVGQGAAGARGDLPNASQPTPQAPSSSFATGDDAPSFSSGNPGASSLPDMDLWSAGAQTMYAPQQPLELLGSMHPAMPGSGNLAGGSSGGLRSRPLLGPSSAMYPATAMPAAAMWPSAPPGGGGNVSDRGDGVGGGLVTGGSVADAMNAVATSHASQDATGTATAAYLGYRGGVPSYPTSVPYSSYTAATAPSSAATSSTTTSAAMAAAAAVAAAAAAVGQYPQHRPAMDAQPYTRPALTSEYGSYHPSSSQPPSRMHNFYDSGLVATAASSAQQLPATEALSGLGSDSHIHRSPNPTVLASLGTSAGGVAAHGAGGGGGEGGVSSSTPTPSSALLRTPNLHGRQLHESPNPPPSLHAWAEFGGPSPIEPQSDQLAHHVDAWLPGFPSASAAATPMTTTTTMAEDLGRSSMTPREQQLGSGTTDYPSILHDQPLQQQQQPQEPGTPFSSDLGPVAGAATAASAWDASAPVAPAPLEVGRKC